MPDIVKRHAVSVALLALTAAACSGGPASGEDRMGWARAALERNAAIAVVAADAQAGTFTVRLKETGELRIVPLDQLVAGPVGTVGPVPAAASASAAAPSAGAGAKRGNDALTAGNSAESADTAEAANAAAAANGTKSANTTEPTNPAATDDAASDTVSGGTPARSALASRGESARAANQQPANSGTAAQPAAGPRATSAASAPAGQVLASGPGYTIKASGARGGDAGAAARTARGIPLERLHDPIICQGARLLHIDNRNLQFDGDAISAENGCEIHITNSHIHAGGVGVQARAANVYVENSDIEGESGAIDAAQGAQIYAEASRFKGLTRRQQSSDFHDLGGNVWN